jgi:hypothetical protein
MLPLVDVVHHEDTFRSSARCSPFRKLGLSNNWPSNADSRMCRAYAPEVEPGGAVRVRSWLMNGIESHPTACQAVSFQPVSSLLFRRRTRDLRPWDGRRTQQKGRGDVDLALPISAAHFRRLSAAT